MGKATLAHQRAIGEIGQARAQKLIDAGLTVLFTADVERLRERVATLERENKLLLAAALDGGVGVPLDELREAVGQG